MGKLVLAAQALIYPSSTFPRRGKGELHLWGFHTLNRCRRLHRIMQQTRNRHGAYTAGHGGDAACHFLTRCKITIADQFVFAVALNAVYPYVNHARTGFYPIAFDHFRAAHGGDDEVGAAHDGGQIF